MKILMFAGGSYVSGLEIVTLHLIRQLKREGNEVRCIISGWNDGMFIKELQKIDVPFDEVKLGWIYVRKPFWTIDSLAYLPGAYLRCRKILKAFEPDIIHFCNYGSVIFLFPLLEDKVCVYNVQESHEPIKKNLFIFHLLNKRIKAFTAVSQYTGQVLADLGIPKEKIRVIYNGVPAIQQPSAKQAGDRFVFGIIGQVARWKGHATLMNAVNLLKASYPALLVKIFGNDKTVYAEELRRSIRKTGTEDYFIWEGLVREQDVIYSQVDAVIVPSLSQEPCSLTIVESMMWGKSLIVSDRGSNPELIQDQETGYIFKADDAVQLADCMRLFLERVPPALDMGRRAHEKALAAFTADKMAAAYARLYVEVVR